MYLPIIVVYPYIGEWIHLFPSLKYSFPAVPKNGEKPRPMSNDQKLQNSIFLRCAQSLWRKIKSELSHRLAEVGNIEI